MSCKRCVPVFVLEFKTVTYIIMLIKLLIYSSDDINVYQCLFEEL